MDEEEIFRCLRVISRIEPSPEAVERAKERIRQAVRNEEEREENLITKTGLSTALSTGRSIIESRIVKLAAVAVVIIAALVGVHRFSIPSNGAGVAWAEVIENVEQVQAFIYRRRLVETSADTEKVRELETMVYISSEYGIRMDNYRNGQVAYSQFTIPALRLIMKVFHLTKQYSHKSLSGEAASTTTQDAGKELVKRYISADYKEVGREIIDGVEAEGIEVADPNVVYGTTHPIESLTARLWVDVDTDLPVLLEMEIVFENGVTQNIVLDEFDWNARLTAGVFEPDIPDDYTLMKEEREEPEAIEQE